MVALSSSSSFEIPAWDKKYDVFLSFRGEDTGKNFASHLHAALHAKNIKTCSSDHDEIAEKEEALGPQSSKAIDESKLSVIVFSENYAFSVCCLEELTHILECKRNMGQIVLPIFYNVDPSQVREQLGSYATAFSFHEERLKHDGADKLQQWRDALTEAGSLSGWDTSRLRSESELVEAVIRNIQRILDRTLLSADLKGLVGIEKRIKKIIELLRIGSSDIRVVGIWGEGGIGKTTLAMVVYNHMSTQFEDSYFLANVREESERSGLVSLQRKLITELFEEEDTSAESSTIVEGMQKSKRVFLVLDDVDLSKQFELLAREQYKRFSPGSRIMVTTRDAQVLRKITADGVYEVEELNDDEAMQLFHFNALRSNFPTADYLEESKRIVEYSKGLPLVIKTMGSYLKSKSRYEWKSAITKLIEVPNMDVQKVLRISYDGLDDAEKDTFLDIACFLKGKDRKVAEQLLGCNGADAHKIIDHLIDKSLLTLKHSNQLWMHDLVQEMGRKIVCQEERGNSRPCDIEDVSLVLNVNTGTAAIEGMSLEKSEINKKKELSPTVFKNMSSLRLLKISSYDEDTMKWNVSLPQGLQSLPDKLRYLPWENYPLKSLSQNFNPQNLVELGVTNGHINDLSWHRVQDLRHLKLLDLSYSKQLTKITDFDVKAPNLECLRLQFCTSLAQVSFQYLDKLRILNLRGCSSIKEFPMLPRNIRNLDLSLTSIRQVPSIIGHLCYLETLNLKMCKNLEFLPGSISSLNFLKELSICCCMKLKYLPELPLYLPNLNAKGCTSLKTLSKSRILTPGLDDSFQHSSGRFDFLNCLKLDENARINIMAKARYRLLKLAISSQKDKEGRISETWCPGNEIPNFLRHQSKESSIRVVLPRTWLSGTNFLGFALGVVVDFKKCYVDHTFNLYFRFAFTVDSHHHEAADHEILTFNWKNDLDGSDHRIIVDSEHVFLFNFWNKNSFAANDDIAASFTFSTNNSSCKVKSCGVRLLNAEDVEEILKVITQDLGKLSETEDVVTDFEDVSHSHDPETSSSLIVHDARTKKEEDMEKGVHGITQDIGESSEEEEEPEEDLIPDFEDRVTHIDPISDIEDAPLSHDPESCGSRDIDEAHIKKEKHGDSNPTENNRKIESTYSCSCLMFLSLVVDILKHVLGRQSESVKDPHHEEWLQAPDKVLHSIVTELGEHNKRISQHLQTVMPKTSHESFDFQEESSNSRIAPSHSTATEKDLNPESPEDIIDSLCSQIIGVRDQNSKILQNLRALVPTAPDVQFGELFPELTSSPSASRINDLFKDVIADEQHVQVSEEEIHSLRSHLTELRDHNQQILQFLRTAILSNSPTPTKRFSGELIKAAGSSSSSSSTINLKKHDVFISFCGEDTRNNFTSHLYVALSEKNIKTYIDDHSIEKGDEVSPALDLKAIQESKISIIIFTENYASSTWCLDELNHILQCKDQHGQLVVPVFYHIYPSHVRKQQGSYKRAFAAHEERFIDNENKVKQWKGALERAASLPGWDSSVTRPESKLVESIVNDVLEKLSVISASGYEDKGLVGTARLIKQIESLLQMGSSDDTTRIVGIASVVGIGKTALARVVYNQFASQFQSCCFLENVNEETERHGLSHLQNKLFSELLKEKDPNMINMVLKDRVRRSKALIVLDNVDALEQFEYLAGDRDWFGPGSRIIITTRNVQTLSHLKVDEVYEVEELNFGEAFQLFCSNAFGYFSVLSDYRKLSMKVINRTKRIPLVLQDIGYRLYSKNIEEWESELSRLGKGSLFLIMFKRILVFDFTTRLFRGKIQERTKKAPKRGIKEARSGLQRTKHSLRRALKLPGQRAHFCRL